MDVVIVGVAHHDQMLSGHSLELSNHGDAARVAGAGPPERIARPASDIDACREDEQHDERARQRYAYRTRFPFHVAQMAHSLRKKRIDDASYRRRIVWCRPDHRKNSREA